MSRPRYKEISTLPQLRVQEAYEAAELEFKSRLGPRDRDCRAYQGAIQAAVRAVLETICDGSYRWGTLCGHCGGLQGPEPLLTCECSPALQNSLSAPDNDLLVGWKPSPRETTI